MVAFLERSYLFFGFVFKGSWWPIGVAIRHCSLLRNRMLADPSFLFKVATEVWSNSITLDTVDIGIYEYHQEFTFYKLNIHFFPFISISADSYWFLLCDVRGGSKEGKGFLDGVWIVRCRSSGRDSCRHCSSGFIGSLCKNWTAICVSIYWVLGKPQAWFWSFA